MKKLPSTVLTFAPPAGADLSGARGAALSPLRRVWRSKEVGSGSGEGARLSTAA